METQKVFGSLLIPVKEAPVEKQALKGKLLNPPPSRSDDPEST